MSTLTLDPPPGDANLPIGLWPPPPQAPCLPTRGTAPSSNPSPLTPNPHPPNPFPLTSFFPPDHLSLLLGHPGTAKSLLALHLAAGISRGQSLNSLLTPNPIPDPDLEGEPGLAIIAAREDDSHTIERRLLAAGADLNYIEIAPFTSFIPFDRSGKKPLHETDSPLDTLIFSKLFDRRPRLLILDPLPAFLENHDSTHSTAIRNILQPFLTSTLESNITVIGIVHLNKQKSSRFDNPLHRANGSNAYTALARSVLFVTPDTRPGTPISRLASPSSPLSPQSSNLSPSPNNRRLLIPLKNNTIPITHALAFSIHTAAHIEPDSYCPAPPYLQFDPTPITDHPLLHPTDTPDPTDALEKSQLDLAVDFLQISLAKGPASSKALLKEAHAIGLSTSTINRARNLLKIKVSHNGKTNQWLAHLPAGQPPS